MKEIHLAENVSRLRKEKGLTQQELAALLGVTNKAVSRWETGDGYPEITLLPPLANALGVSIDGLMTGEPSEGRSSRIVWADFLSYFLLVIAWLIPIVWFSLPITGILSSPLSTLFCYLALWGLCLYFRRNCCVQLLDGGRSPEAASACWFTAYKCYLAASFFMLIRIVDVTIAHILRFSAAEGASGAWELAELLWSTEAYPIFLMSTALAAAAGLYYICVRCVEGNGLDRNEPILSCKRRWLSAAEQRSITAGNWLVALWAGLSLGIGEAVRAGLLGLAAIWIAAVIFSAIIRFGLKSVETGKKRIYYIRDIAAVTFALLLSRVQILPYWVSETGRRSNAAPIASSFGNAQKHWEIQIGGENLLMALVGVVLLLLLFEAVMAVIAGKEAGAVRAGGNGVRPGAAAGRGN